MIGKGSDTQIYFNWSCNALLGGDPVGADNYLRQNLATIQKVAKKLLNDIAFKQRTMYRGVILENTIEVLPPHPNFTYLSFTEDPVIAFSFADPTPAGFGSVGYLGEHGYVIEYAPKFAEVIFHHQFLNLLPYVQAFARMGFTADTLLEQKEVMILQPAEPFTKLTYYKDFKI